MHHRGCRVVLQSGDRKGHGIVRLCNSACLGLCSSGVVQWWGCAVVGLCRSIVGLCNGVVQWWGGLCGSGVGQ